MQALILNKTGDAGVLKLKEVEDPKPKKNEVVIAQKAVGVNFFDICFRRGQYKLSQMPAILGTEGCGVIEEVGPGVVDFKVGERVAYATGPIGAYAQKRVINQHHVVPVPPDLPDVLVAGSLSKALMAHTLLFRVYLARRAKRMLVHAAAGGVGQFLCQWGNHLGVEVIGTVGSDAKIAQAQANGCEYVINHKKTDFLQEVAKITNGNGLGLVYDGVGKATLLKSIDCLWPMGMCVSFGESSGNTDKLDLNTMVLNSLYLTRPTLALYKAKKAELSIASRDVFEYLRRGILRPKITTYDFKDAAKAHKALESGESMGSLVLTL